jgi:hypothetical protein
LKVGYARTFTLEQKARFEVQLRELGVINATASAA